ncbi:MAG: hypothetical protein CMP25_01820 [Rickettsiales bacterium]|nr:hypothetical protein [Rickettsiales bacterium]
MEYFLTNKYIENLRMFLNLSELDDIYFLSFLLLVIGTIVVFVLFTIMNKNNEEIQKISTTSNNLNGIINKTENIKMSGNDNDFIDVLVAIEEEMAAIRELYVGGYITKGIYISETDRLYEKAKIFGL